nr:MAG TPA: hypothetical protein [Caudoviricetes sp.]
MSGHFTRKAFTRAKNLKVSAYILCVPETPFFLRCRRTFFIFTLLLTAAGHYQEKSK